MLDITDSTFKKEVIEKSKKIPVVVDFWAPWCMPCRMLKPILEKVSEKNDKFVLAKLNVEENTLVSAEYDVMSIPCVKLFKDGKFVDEFTGAYPETYIMQWLVNNGVK